LREHASGIPQARYRLCVSSSLAYPSWGSLYHGDIDQNDSGKKLAEIAVRFVSGAS
jgi:hypothetical protein